MGVAITLLTLCLIACAGAQLSSITLHVSSATDATDNPDCSSTTPCASISWAIQVACNQTLLAEIIVSPGNYSVGNVTIEDICPPINIRSSGGSNATTIVQKSTGDEYILRCYGPAVTLEGFTCTNIHTTQPFYFDGCANVTLRDMQFQNCSGEYLVRSYTVQNTRLENLVLQDCQAEFEVLGVVGGQATLVESVWERVDARQLIVIARWDNVTVDSLVFRSVNATDLLELSGNTFGSYGILSHIQLEAITSSIQLSGHSFDLHNITIITPALPPEQTIFEVTCDSLELSDLSHQGGMGGLLSVKPLISQIDLVSLSRMNLGNVSSSTRSIIEMHNVNVAVMTNTAVNYTSTPTLVEVTQSWLDVNASTTLLVEQLTVTQSAWNQLVRSTGSRLSLKTRDVFIESNVNYKITELDCAFSLGSEQTMPLVASFTNLVYRSNQQPLLNAEYATDVEFTDCLWENNQASLIKLTNGMVNMHDVQLISNQVPLLPLIEFGMMSGSFVNVNVSSNQCKDCLLWESCPSFTVNNTQFSNNSVSDGSLIALLDSQATMYNVSAHANTLSSSTVMKARGHSNLSLTLSHFQENEGTMEGVIYCDGQALLLVKDSVFLSNREAVLTMWGESAAVLNNSLFQANTGGSVLINEGASISIEASRFVDNQGVLGGAVALLGNSNSSRIQACDFINCTSEIAGGAIYATGYSQFILSNCTIQTCEALGGSVTAAQYARPNIQQCHFINNTGSALVLNDRSNASVQDTWFIGNSVPSSGGAIIITASSELRAENCEFDGNRCGSQGGGVAVINQGRATLVSCRAHNHNARAAGFLYATDSTHVEIRECEIRENTAQSSGGALYCSGSATVIIGSTHIEYNNALSNAGGGMYSQGASNITMSHSIIRNNTALQGGGVYSSSKVGMEAFNCTVSGNKADSTGGGGGMHLSGTGIHHWRQSTFMSNEATRADGGAIYMELAVVMNFYNCSFSLNHGRKGGAIYLEDNAAMQASLTLFQTNDANLGGAIYVGLGADCFMNTTMCQGNRATSHGGGLYVEGDMTISDCQFEENIAFYSGGAISLLSLTPSLADSSFRENSALKGGALSLESQEHSLWNRGPEFYGLEMEENRASLGGAIYVLLLGSSTPTFHSATTFSGNRALLGGAVFIDTLDSNQTLLYDAFFDNNTVLYGGSTIGFGELDEEQEAWALNPEGLCVNCTYALRSNQTQIYQNQKGFASIPSSLDFLPGYDICHRALPVDSGPLLLQVGLYDAFHTPVTGRILEDESMFIHMTLDSSNATVTPDSHSQPLSNSTGAASFANIQVCGPSGSVVSARFDCENCNIFNGSQYEVRSLDDCSFLWQGCSSSDDIPAILPSDDDTTCAVCVKQHNYVVQVFGLLMVIVLALLISLIGIVGTLCWTRYKRRRTRRIYESIEIPDFSSSSLSFHSLLVDASITRLAWDEMEVNMADVIGHGASGLVMQGLHHSSRGSRTVALKQLVLGMEELEPDSLNEFLREIKLMNALRHEHIVDFIGICLPPDESCLYLVEELMERGSIHDILAKKRENVTVELRFRFAIGAAKGLAHLHSKKLIHRDIKTDNLLVDKAWNCKIADFGISTVRPSITRNMTCVGTPTFMAPEVLSNEKYSEKADVYSFGIVLYELFSGKRPYSTGRFKHMNLAVLNGAIVAGARPPIDQFPFPLQALIRDCWNENPDLRPHCEEITTRLERLAAEGFDELSLSETETETETE